MWDSVYASAWRVMGWPGRDGDEPEGGTLAQPLGGSPVAQDEGAHQVTMRRVVERLGHVWQFAPVPRYQAVRVGGQVQGPVCRAVAGRDEKAAVGVLDEAHRDAASLAAPPSGGADDDGLSPRGEVPGEGFRWWLRHRCQWGWTPTAWEPAPDAGRRSPQMGQLA